MEDWDNDLRFSMDRRLPEKDFEALTFDEQEIVRKGIGESEYRRLREILRRSVDIFADESLGLEPDPQIKAALMQRFQAAFATGSSQRASWFARAIRFRIPAYQALMAASVLILLAVFLQRNFFIQAMSKQYIPILQTLHVREYILIPSPVHPAAVPHRTVKASGNPAPEDQKKKPIRRDVMLPDLFAAHVRATDQLLQKVSAAGVGSNASNDSLLFQLLVTVN